MPTGQQIVDRAQTQAGKAYGRGLGRTDPEHSGYADCSGLVYWAVKPWFPNFPTNSATQFYYCKNAGLQISQKQAIETPGALLVWGPEHHIGISRGDGTTIEARGHAWPIGNFSATQGRAFNLFCLIAGVDYAGQTQPGGTIDDVPVPEFGPTLLLPQHNTVLRLKSDGAVFNVPPGQGVNYGSAFNFPSERTKNGRWWNEITPRRDGNPNGYTIWATDGAYLDFGEGAPPHEVD